MFLEVNRKTAILSGKEVSPLRGGGHGVLALCMLYLLRKKSEAPDSYTSLYGALKIGKIAVFRAKISHISKNRASSGHFLRRSIIFRRDLVCLAP